MKIAVIGGGISGIASAHILKKNGHDPIVFERSAAPGGVWAEAYPDVHLQNIASQYYLSDFPWPFKPDFHPSGEQIRNYLQQAIRTLGLEVRTQHEVTALIEEKQGWTLHGSNPSGNFESFFDFVLVSTGHFTQSKVRPAYPGEHCFKGTVLDERATKNRHVFTGKKVAIIGLGKTALDMATFAVGRAAEVHHVFRSPRWMLQEHILGIHFTKLLFCRFGLVMMPSWVQPSRFERFLHQRQPGLVKKFWDLVAFLLKREILKHQKKRDPASLRRLQSLIPEHDLLPDLGAKTALAPERYVPLVATGQIVPHHADLIRFEERELFLSNGQHLTCDLVLLCLGFQTPIFPFLPEKYRALLENEVGGAQLYRHMLHPRIPNLAFAGFNHGFMHVPTVEVGVQWICAVLDGQLKLPSAGEMEASMQRVAQWKQENMHYDPARAYGTSTRFQQYLDLLLKELDLSPYRKMPNVLAEVFGRYGARDYRGVSEVYLAKKQRGVLKARIMNNLDT